MTLPDIHYYAIAQHTETGQELVVGGIEGSGMLWLIPFREKPELICSLNPLSNLVFRHSKKGTLYQILGYAIDLKSAQMHVIYQGLEGGQLWARPYPNFVEVVEIDGRRVPRFVQVPPWGKS